MNFTDALYLTQAIPELEKTAGALKNSYDMAEEFLKTAGEEEFGREIAREQAHIKIAGESEDNTRFQRVAWEAHEYEKVAAWLESAYEAKGLLEKFEEEHGEGSVHKEIVKEAGFVPVE